MIENLESRMTDDNRRIINQLIDLIVQFDITDEKGLADLEEFFFMTDDEKLDKVEFCVGKLNRDHYIFEAMPSEDVTKMFDLMDLCNAESDDEKKLYYIIKMFDLAEYDLYLPSTAYKYIMSGQL